MTIRSFINLIESMHEDNMCQHIAELISDGEHEGFNPYWKLVADSRILSDMDAMSHISHLVYDGITSGTHPTWELKFITPSENIHEDDIIDEDEMLDEDVDTHEYKVVAVAEINGPDKGWFEVDDSIATLFVVEDSMGNPHESFQSRALAQQYADELNSGKSPEEINIYAGRDFEEPIKHELIENSDLSNLPDFAVIIRAIHERGPKQKEALAELHSRGLWLSDAQKQQAGLI